MESTWSPEGGGSRCILAWKVTGSGQPVSSFVLPYNGQQLKGSQLDQQCDPRCYTDGKSRVMTMMMMMMMAAANEARFMRLFLG